jgi:hypothetical protein
VEELLGPEGTRRLTTLLATLAEGPGQGPPRKALMRLLVTALPPDHPVTRAVLDEAQRGGTATLDLDAVEEEARLLLATLNPAPTAEEVRERARARLLAAPAYPLGEVAQPEAEGLIRLTTPSGATRLPAFQFASDGRAREVVVQINRLLGCDRDPWGAAGWWLSPHLRLGGVPADLLDEVDGEALVRAAHAVREWG